VFGLAGLEDGDGRGLALARPSRSLVGIADAGELILSAFAGDFDVEATLVAIRLVEWMSGFCCGRRPPSPLLCQKPPFENRSRSSPILLTFMLSN
jgi:hypothetical protein